MKLLNATHDEARTALKACGEALDVYRTVPGSQEHLLSEQKRLDELGQSLSTEVDKLDPIAGCSHVRLLDDEDALSMDLKDWIHIVPHTLRSINELHAPILSAVQTATIATMKHRNLLTWGINTLKSDEGVQISDGNVDVVERTSDRLMIASKNALGMAEGAQETAQIIALAQIIHRSANLLQPNISDLLSRSRDLLHEPLDLDTTFQLERDFTEMQSAMNSQIEKPFSVLDARLTLRHPQSVNSGVLGNRIVRYQADSTEIDHLLRLSKEIGAQETTVNQIEGEAASFLTLLDGLQCETNGLQDLPSSSTEVPSALESLRARLSTLTTEVRQWDSSLWQRITWVSPQPAFSRTDLAGSSGVVAEDDPAISFSIPPLTPPASPTIQIPSSHSALISTRALDHSARLRTNQASARVNASLSTLKVTIESIPWLRWSVSFNDRINHHNQWDRELLADGENLQHTLSAISDALTLESLDIQQTQALLEKCEDLQARGLSQINSVSSLGKLVTEMIDQIKQCPDTHPAEHFERLQGTVEDIRISHQTLTAGTVRLGDEIQHIGASIRHTLKTPKQIPIKVVDDVFGPLTTVDSTAESTDTHSSVPILESTRQRLDALALDLIVRPDSAGSAAAPAIHRLPTAPTARRIKDELYLIRQALVGMKDKPEPAGKKWKQLHVRVEAALLVLPRLDELVHIGDASRQCDDVFSNLIEALDEIPMSVESVTSVADEALAGVAHLEDTAMSFKGDYRVDSIVKRAFSTWEELRSLAAAAIHPSRAPSTVDFDDDLFEIASTGTFYPGLTRSTNGSFVDLTTPTSSRPSSRTKSNPLTKTYMSATKSSQARSASDTVYQAGSLSRIPRMRYESMRSSKSSTRLSLSSVSPSFSTLISRSVSSVNTPAGPFTIGRRQSAATDRTPKPVRSRLSSTTRSPSKKAYVPDPKSKLDVAVGRVINKLYVSVFAPVVLTAITDGCPDQTCRSGCGRSVEGSIGQVLDRR